jgi:hypothetical protein
MAVAVLFPFLDLKDLLQLGSVNKNLREFLEEKVRYDTLFLRYTREYRLVEEDMK